MARLAPSESPDRKTARSRIASRRKNEEKKPSSPSRFLRSQDSASSRKETEAPVYTSLRRLITSEEPLTMNDIGNAVELDEQNARKTFNTLTQERSILQNEETKARKEKIQRYLNMSAKDRLEARVKELKKSVEVLSTHNRAPVSAGILQEALASLEERLAKENVRLDAQSHDEFTASLMDALDAKQEAPDLEELEGRLSGIQDAVAKLNKDVLGEDRVKNLRGRADQYQQRLSTEKAADALRPREVASSEFTRLERQVADFGKILQSEEGLRYPDKARARINELRKEVLQLSNIPGARENPRYDALLQELHEGDLAIADVEGDELTKLLQEIGENEQTFNNRDISIRPDGSQSYRPDAVDAVQNRLGQVTSRLKEAFDASDARFSPTYGQAKQKLTELERRIEALRNPTLSPSIEARAIVPERKSTTPKTEASRSEALFAAETLQRKAELLPNLPPNEAANDNARVSVPRANPRPLEPKMSHVALIAPNRSIEWQLLEAEIQSNDRTQQILNLEDRLEQAQTTQERQSIENELVRAGHLYEVALKREFILLNANPHAMASSLDHAADLHTKILNDVIGQEVVAKIRAMEERGETFDLEAANAFADADERAFARQWLSVRRTSRIVEDGIMHLREYHKAQLKLLRLREELVVACKKCFIPKEVRDELEAAKTPAERRRLVDEILRDPEAMDKTQTVRQFFMKGALVFNRMLKAFPGLKVMASDREFANKAVDDLVKELRIEHANFDQLRAGRTAFADLSPMHGAANSLPTEATLRDPLEASPETEGPFGAFMELSERARALITDLKGFKGEVTDKVISRFNSRLSNMEESMSTYETPPPALKSIFELAQAQLADARHELANLQRRQTPEIALGTPKARNDSESTLPSPERAVDLQSIEDSAEELLDEVNDAVNEGRALGDADFRRVDRESILLSARLRSLEDQKDTPAFLTAQQTLQELEKSLDQYEEQTLAKDSVNKNRPAEVIFKSGIVSRLEKVVKDNPKRAALSHYLTELNDGQGVRAERSDDVQEVLLTFLKRYSTMHPVEQRNAARSFQKVYELLDLSDLYRDLRVTNLDQLAASVGKSLPEAQASQQETEDDLFDNIDLAA